MDDLKLPQKKKQKVSYVVNLEDVNNSSSDKIVIKPWLSFRGIHLMEDDKATLRFKELTDLHINLAQEILRNQFPNVHGLQTTHLLPRSCKLPRLSTNSLFLQIVHSRGNHWIAIAAQGPSASVQVFDSMYTIISDETQKLCVTLFGTERKVEKGRCTQQEGTTDCGVHAIATCTALAHGKEPVFSRGGMRDHLISCFERLSFTPFV